MMIIIIKKQTLRSRIESRKENTLKMVTLLDQIVESKARNKTKEVYIMGVKVLKMESNERGNGNPRVDDCV